MANGISMKISEFIQQDKIDETCNRIVEKLIERALRELYELYGTDSGWAIDELDAAESDIDITAEQIIQDVEYYTFVMSNSINVAMYMDEGLFKYKKRPLFEINGQLVVDATIYDKPLILALQQLITIFDNPLPDVVVVYNATKLVDTALTCRLLVQLNLNWICEMSRNTNFQGITAQQKEFDEEPVNKIRKDALMPFAFDHLLKDGSLTVTELYKLIEKPYQEKLVKLYYEGKIQDYDRNDIKKDVDVTKVSKSVMERWLTEFKQLLDAAGD